MISAHIDHVWIKALVLVAIHLAAPLMRPWLKNKERVINAFGGGLAISYVFLHLLPEVAEGKEHLGMYSFFIVLCGFVFFYLANVLAKRSNKNVHKTTQHYRVSLGSYWLYSFILVIGLPRDFSESHLHIMLMTFAAVLHIIHEDFELAETHHRFFDKTGRYILATAPIVGIFVRWYILPESDYLVHAITSLLAGSLLFNVARNELETPSRASLMWFFTGIITYSGLLYIIQQT